MATRSLGTLTLDLVLRLGGFKQGTGQAEREFKRFTSQMQAQTRTLTNIFRNIGGAIVGGLAVRAVVQATSEAEAAFAKLNAAVIANGGAAGRSAQELADMSSELQSMTTYADDAIQVAQSLLLRFQSISGENFDRATAAVLDLAAALDQDLGSVAKLLGRALEDPEKGLTRLARAGVIFSSEQTKVIEKLVETGRTAEAQTVILDTLEAKFGNAAEAARNNFGGALTGLRNAFGDLLEAKKGLPGAVSAIEKLTKVISDPGTKAAFDTLLSGFIKSLATAIDFVAELTGGIAALAGKGANEAVNIGLQIEKLQNQRASLNPFVPGSARELEEINRQLDILLAKERALLGLTPNPTRGLSGPQTRPNNGPRGRSQEGIVVLTPEQSELRDKLIDQLEDARSAQDKYNESVKEANALRQAGAITEEQLNAAKQLYLDTLNKAQAKETRSATSSAANSAAQRAAADALEAQAKAYEDVYNNGIEAIEGLRTPVEEQIAQYQETKYALEQLAATYPNLADAAEAALQRLEVEGLEPIEITAEKLFPPEEQEQLGVFFEEASRNTQNILADFLFDPFQDGIKGLLDSFIQMLQRMAAEAVAAQIAQKIFGTGVGGSGGLVNAGLAFLGGLVGGGGGSAQLMSQMAAAGLERTYAGGGYTGDGGKYEPAGVVHRGEYVVSAERVRKPGVLGLLASDHLEALAAKLRGFSSGGLVGASIPMTPPTPAAAMMNALNPGSRAMNVTQQFAISAPNGTVSAATQQQIAAAAARGLLHANRRNN